MPIEKLTPDQQHLLAEVELGRLQKRERLLRKARSYPGKRWLSLALFILAVWIAGKNLGVHYGIVASLILAAVFALIQLHVAGINQRLDALLELLDADRNAPNTRESVVEDKAA